MKEFDERIAALKAEYEQRLAEKEAENALLRQNKKAAEERARAQAKQYEDYLNEYISVKLFKDNNKYKDVYQTTTIFVFVHIFPFLNHCAS